MIAPWICGPSRAAERAHGPMVARFAWDVERAWSAVQDRDTSGDARRPARPDVRVDRLRWQAPRRQRPFREGDHNGAITRGVNRGWRNVKRGNHAIEATAVVVRIEGIGRNDGLRRTGVIVVAYDDAGPVGIGGRRGEPSGCDSQQDALQNKRANQRAGDGSPRRALRSACYMMQTRAASRSGCHEGAADAANRRCRQFLRAPNHRGVLAAHWT